MKKSNLKLGLLLIVFLATLSIQQTAAAFSISELFRKDKDENISSENGEVLSTQTEEPSNTSESSEQSEPEKEEVIVEVVKGDSLSKIAKAHNIDYKRIFDANESIADPNVINPGQKIRIPEPSEELPSRPLPEKVVSQPVITKSNPVKTTKQKTAPSQPAPSPSDGSVWDRLAQCESGGRWNIASGNGYYGGLQFSASTWRAVGGSGLPHQHSREEQIRRAEILLSRSGWGQWPACSKKLGLR